MVHVIRPTFGPNGFISPEEAEILTDVKEDINDAFGGGLNMADETPQGQLAVSMTAIIGHVNDTFQFYTTQVDPAFSTGRMQDGIARIYFIERNPSQPTTVQALCTGLTGVLIPVGSVAQSDDGNLYVATGSGTIGLDGTTIVPFACTQNGPIPCEAGTLNTIYQSIPGWDSITNPSEGVLGRNTESRAAFERRRALSVAQNSAGSLPSVLGAVLNVAGVLDAYVVENVDNVIRVIGGVSLAPNSIYVAAVGGNPADVARAIWTRKAPGCAYNGNTTIVVQDTSPSYAPPLPSYAVSYQIPSSLPVIFEVTIDDNDKVPANAVDLIQQAIITAFAGEDGGPRQSIGAKVFASRYYPSVINLGSWSQVINIKVGSSNNFSAKVSGSIGGSVLHVTGVISGVLAAGQTVQGSGVSPGTTILNQASGTVGGVGFYNISKAQTVALGTLYGVVANLDDFVVNVNQAPTVVADDITVLLE